MIEEDSVGLLTLMVNYISNGGLIENSELNYVLSNVDLSYAKKYRFFAEESLYSKVLSVIESYELSISVDKVLLSNKSHKL